MRVNFDLDSSIGSDTDGSGRARSNCAEENMAEGQGRRLRERRKEEPKIVEK